MAAVIDASRRVYEIILYAYPDRLRAEFGADMTSIFEQQLLDARRDGGPLEVCRVWGRALWETAHIVVLPRFAPACRIAVVSLVSSSALFLLLFWTAGFARHCVK